jgi:hypothetical protein
LVLELVKIDLGQIISVAPLLEVFSKVEGEFPKSQAWFEVFRINAKVVNIFPYEPMLFRIEPRE